MANSQQISIKQLPHPPKPGPSRQNIVQVVTKGNSLGVGSQAIIQQRPPAFKPIQIRPSIPSSAQLYLNTNTALQYTTPVKRKMEVGDHGTYSKLGGNAMILGSGGPVTMTLPSLTQTGPTGVTTSMGGPNSSRKPCNCTKSHCLKLYCECFAQGQLCQNCNCNNCMNNLTYEEERARAIKMTLDRNPMAFHPKIGRGEGERKHTKGCNCKRSGCLKNYCECYEAKISCSDLCRCQGCRNTEDSIERRSLMRLAAMGSLKAKQPSSIKKHLVGHPADTNQASTAGYGSATAAQGTSYSQMMQSQPVVFYDYYYPEEALPHVFITWEVAEATCGCMLAQADDAERRDILPAAQERIILEEFGRCLSQIIESASKALPRSGTSGVLMSGSAGSVGGEPGGGSGASSAGEGDDHHISHHSHHHLSHHHSRPDSDSGVVLNV